jgi:ABC-type sugar transport system ATPase subunit
MSTAAKLVEVVNVSKRFGGLQAVDDVSCDLHEGEVVGLLGHNGAGKSTLIKLLSGVYPIDSGDTRRSRWPRTSTRRAISSSAASCAPAWACSTATAWSMKRAR